MNERVEQVTPTERGNHRLRVALSSDLFEMHSGAVLLNIE